MFEIVVIESSANALLKKMNVQLLFDVVQIQEGFIFSEFRIQTHNSFLDKYHDVTDIYMKSPNLMIQFFNIAEQYLKNRESQYSQGFHVEQQRGHCGC